jgi:hypothetical protein
VKSLTEQYPIRIDTEDLGVVGVCRIGVADPYSDNPAMATTADQLLAAIGHYTFTRVLTPEEFVATDARLRDRI